MGTGSSVRLLGRMTFCAKMPTDLTIYLHSLEDCALKKLLVSLALMNLLAISEPAVGVIGTIDNVPAATLLLPYFEVDLDSAFGFTTLFEINNASSKSVIAHVVLWSDLSVPILDFNVYLTGYDVQTINMRDVLNLVLPRTAPPATDPEDLISPGGEYSDVEMDFESCEKQLPYPEGTISVSLSQDIKDACTGRPVAGREGLCFGTSYGDNTCRGYVTVDVVGRCSLQFPGDPGYFVAGGKGVALNDNVLWGNYYHVDLSQIAPPGPRPDQGIAEGETLVHIEADGLNPKTATPGKYTYYGRYVGWNAADNREPLVSGFNARYVRSVNFPSGTDLTVWRDSKEVQSPFACDTVPAPPFPLAQEAIIIFDEKENPDVLVAPRFPVSPLPSTNPYPYQTQRIEVGGAGFEVPFSSGWLYLNLNAGNINGNPPEDPFASQNWVTVVMSAEDRFSVGFDAIQLDNAGNANHLDPDENPATGGAGDNDAIPVP
jgi:hypothetical protein